MNLNTYFHENYCSRLFIPIILRNMYYYCISINIYLAD